MKKVYWFLAIGFLFVEYQNCQGSNFVSAGPGPSATAIQSGNSPTCTLAAETQPVKLKIFFMVDNSGSTSTTDPKQYFRVLAVQNLIAEYGSNTNFQYGYGIFSGTTAQVFDVSTSKFVSTTGGFTPFGNVNSLQSALTTFEAMGAGTNTPYKAAFAAIQSAITQDLAAGKGYAYSVVFMSDGGPSDLPVDQSSNFNTVIPQNEAALKTMVDQLKSTAAAGGTTLTVDSIYFGSETAAAGGIANLQTIASEGDGQFVDTNLTTTLNFAQIITLPPSACAL